MPEYLSPGVYVEEIEVGTKPIEGVSTSNLGIAGPTERGPSDVRLVTSLLEFQRLYGNPIRGSHLAHAVKGFFDNGGRRCFMARVTGAGATSAGSAFGPLQLTALGPGVWGNNVLVRITDPMTGNAPNPNRFRLVLAYYATLPPTFPVAAPAGGGAPVGGGGAPVGGGGAPVGGGGAPAAPPAPPAFVDPSEPGSQSRPGYVRPDVLEVFDNLSFDVNDANYVLRVLGGSNLVFAGWVQGQNPGRPGNTAPNDPNATGFAALAGGADGGAALNANDYTGRDEGPEQRNGAGVSWSTALLGLERVDEVNLLVAPDEHAVQGLRDLLIDQCERLRDRFALLSVAEGQRQVGNIQVDPPTTFAALYWPWIQVLHPNGVERVTIPPVGHVAGIIARTDIERGVHKAPANAVVRGALELEFPVNRGMQDVLNPRGVNVIRDFRADGNGLRLWGARTMSDDPEWKYVNVRRLFLFLEESIDEGTQWVVFEPNADPLWDRVKRSIESFLLTVWRNGALMGTRPDQAFYVKCDRSTMTQDDIDNGRLICYVGVAPVKPAEFVIFRIHQWALGAKQAV
ncbi:MAG TPA: phage tail sheath subtilisin-like domain-containing protein [Longimicrobium sp.]|nr:phage tail sheath subtilisin-like domain-containing protein [Longimicrobium sp.]